MSIVTVAPSFPIPEELAFDPLYQYLRKPTDIDRMEFSEVFVQDNKVGSICLYPGRAMTLQSPSNVDQMRDEFARAMGLDGASSKPHSSFGCFFTPYFEDHRLGIYGMLTQDKEGKVTGIIARYRDERGNHGWTQAEEEVIYNPMSKVGQLMECYTGSDRCQFIDLCGNQYDTNSFSIARPRNLNTWQA